LLSKKNSQKTEKRHKQHSLHLMQQEESSNDGGSSSYSHQTAADEGIQTKTASPSSPLQDSSTSIDWENMLLNKTPYSPMLSSSGDDAQIDEPQQQETTSIEVPSTSSAPPSQPYTAFVQHNVCHSIPHSIHVQLQKTTTQHMTKSSSCGSSCGGNSSSSSSSSSTGSSSTAGSVGSFVIERKKPVSLSSQSQQSNKCTVLVRYRRKSDWEDIDSMNEWHSDPHKYLWHITIQPHILQSTDTGLSFTLVRCDDDVAMDSQCLQSQLQSKWVAQDGTCIFEYNCHFKTNSHSNRNSPFRVRIFCDTLQIFESQAKMIYARKRNSTASADNDKQGAPLGKKPKQQ